MKLTEVEHEMVREWISAILKNKQYGHLNPIDAAHKWFEKYREIFGCQMPDADVKIYLDGKEISGILKTHKEIRESLESGE